MGAHLILVQALLLQLDAISFIIRSLLSPDVAVHAARRRSRDFDFVYHTSQEQ